MNPGAKVFQRSSDIRTVKKKCNIFVRNVAFFSISILLDLKQNGQTLRILLFENYTMKNFSLEIDLPNFFDIIVLYRNILTGIEVTSIETKGGFYITQIKQLQDRIFERLLLDNGIEISGGQGRILFILWKTDNLTISEISEKTSLAKNTVSVVINGMVNKGIVERNINPHNRRQTIVSLTEYAKSLQEKYELVSQQMNALFYQGFSEEELREFERYLARILKTLTDNLHTDK